MKVYFFPKRSSEILADDKFFCKRVRSEICCSLCSCKLCLKYALATRCKINGESIKPMLTLYWVSTIYAIFLRKCAIVRNRNIQIYRAPLKSKGRASACSRALVKTISTIMFVRSYRSRQHETRMGGNLEKLCMQRACDAC